MKTTAFLAAALAAIGTLAGTLAGALGPAAAEETTYAKMGRWTITAVSDNGRFGYCAADTDNSSVTLRIATDGRQWQVGNPYHDNGPVRGQWGFDGWEDETDFATDGDGWASMNVTRDMLAGLRGSASFSIELDRGPQTWSLRGSSAAMDKAVECARNQGRVAAAPAPRQPQPPAKAPGRRFTQGQKIAPIAGPACPRKGVVVSQAHNNRPVNTTFVNRTRQPVDLFWIDFNSNWVFYARVAPGGRYQQSTYTNHAWVGVQNGACLGQSDWYVHRSNETIEWRG